MKNLILILSLTLFWMFSSSCEKSENDCQSPVEFQVIDFSKYPNIQCTGTTTNDKFFVINSTKDLNENILFNENNEGVAIDFTSHTLLIGNKSINGIPGNLVNQSLLSNCDSSILTYNVNIKNGGYTALGSFIFGILIPKTNAEVKLNIELTREL